MTKGFLALVGLATTPIGMVVVFCSLLHSIGSVGGAGGIQSTEANRSSS